MMVMATFAWVAYIALNGRKKCLEQHDMNDWHQEDVHMADVSAMETVEDVEKGIPSTLSQICDEWEVAALKMSSALCSNFEQCTMQYFLETMCF